jgi:DNA-directed RNA polymerase specialized sigma24 family protein
MEVELMEIDSPLIADLASEVVDRELLDGALRRLAPEGRAIVVLHYFLGLPLPEAAAALEIPLGTAKSRLHRSLVVMRRVIDGDPTKETSALARGHLA